MKTGLPAISNEGGFMTNDTGIMEDTMNEIKNAGFDHWTIMNPEIMGGVGVPEIDGDGKEVINKVVTGTVDSNISSQSS